MNAAELADAWVGGDGRVMALRYVEKPVENRWVAHDFSTSLDPNTDSPHFPQTGKRSQYLSPTDEGRLVNISTSSTTTISFN